jgi:hypothetical protein
MLPRVDKISETVCVLLFVSLVGCSNPVATVRPPAAVSEEQIITAHKKLALDRQIEIEAFINRKGWANIKRTESGLYILLRKDSASIAKTIFPVKYGDTLQLKSNVTLLNGTEIFKGIQDIVTGKTEMAAGLREALLNMHYGESACLIVPSHLAYGFSGNGDNIPAHAALLYEITVLKSFE